MDANADIEITRLSRMLNALQQSLSWRDRPVIANTLAALTNQSLPPSAVALSPLLRGRVDTLQRDGVAYLGRLLTPEQVADIHAHLATKPCHTGHILTQGDGVPRTVAECAKLSNCGSYRPQDILSAPHLLELANSPDLTAIAEAYLGCTPTIYSVNMFWSFPERETRYMVTQQYHRDFDDFRFCTVFLFLTDIDLDNGAHYFVRGTHRGEFVEQAYLTRLTQPASVPLQRFFDKVAYEDKDCPNLFATEIETVTGAAGEAVIEDTYGFHRGDIPKTNRLLGWIRYGLYRNPPSFDDNPQGPAPRDIVAGRIPDTARHRFMNRLLIQP